MLEHNLKIKLIGAQPYASSMKVAAVRRRLFQPDDNLTIASRHEIGTFLDLLDFELQPGSPGFFWGCAGGHPV